MTQANGEIPLGEKDAEEFRRIGHAINNALELIVQAHYLVNTTELSAPAKQWMGLLDQGIRQAAQHTSEMRAYIINRTASTLPRNSAS